MMDSGNIERQEQEYWTPSEVAAVLGKQVQNVRDTIHSLGLKCNMKKGQHMRLSFTDVLMIRKAMARPRNRDHKQAMIQLKVLLEKHDKERG